MLFPLLSPHSTEAHEFLMVAIMDMDQGSYTWIRTRDGSPTLWSNDLGECFRSIKGAFTEAWRVFVEPGIQFIEDEKIFEPTIGEFGLGTGTNWILTSLYFELTQKPHHYFVIERDLQPFEIGMKKWSESSELLATFFQKIDISVSASEIRSLIPQLKLPQIYPSLEAAKKLASHLKADIWYHDPFGYEVNPDGYSPETLQDCAVLWNETCLGVSYACNKRFQNNLIAMGLKVNVPALKDPLLKRERLEFYRQAAAKVEQIARPRVLDAFAD